MNPNRLPRRLAAILYADVAGYSRLTGEDEEGTHRRLSESLDTFTAAIQSHEGRVVHFAGDAILAEFPTVSRALTCAAAAQEDLEARNENLPEERRIRFRVGVNLGEVIVDRDDIYGEGVNVAARLESLAQPGGICLSGAVYDAVGARLPLDYEYMGEQDVKNIARPVRAYQARLQPGAELPLPIIPESTSKRHLTRYVAAALVLVALVAGWLLFLIEPFAPREDRASVETMAFPLPEKPSIAVLPFSNISGDPEQEYFADGMTDDLITDLSKISGLFVIARNSVFTYKGKAVEVRQVAEELGVRYVLEGSVRRAGEQVRINAQLIDATTGGHVWAERYDGVLDDVFTLQDKVTQKIVGALAVNLTAGEEAAHAQIETENPKAYDAFLRGWAYFRRNTPDDFAKAIPYFEEAIRLDPRYSRAHAALAAVFAEEYYRIDTSGGHWAMILGRTPEESLRRQKYHLQAAMAEPTPLAHMVSSRRLTGQGQHAEALAEAERALALGPNDPVAYEAMAIALIYAGKPNEGADMIQRAMRLDPRYPHEYLLWLGLAQFDMEQFDEAIESLTRASRHNPEDDRSLVLLAASLAYVGRRQEAENAITNVNRLRSNRKERLAKEPDRGVQLGIDVFLVGSVSLTDVDSWPFKEPRDRERLREGLRLAGVPAHGDEPNVSPLEIAGAITLDAAGAKELFDRGVTFVDVRGDADWRDGYVPGAVHLDLKGAFNEAALSGVVSKDEEVVIYCMGPRCLRSSEACTKAVSWGFERVYYFRGGFPGWRAEGYPVELPE